VADERAIIASVFEAINRGDWDGALEHAAPEFVYDLTRTDSPTRGVHSRERMREVIEEFLGVWESARYVPSEFIEAPGGWVIPFTTHFRGRQGIEMTMDAIWLVDFRDGMIARLTLFQDRAEALEAAGISE
jgi:ketosteroid isomerase-like protein